MTCSRCTSIPEFKFGRCRIYLQSNVDDLFVKIKNIIEENYKNSRLNENYLDFEVDDFEEFIENLNRNNHLSKKEKDDINILPLSSEQILDFNTFSNTKSLNKWINIVKSEDLVFILKNNSLITHFQPIVNVRDNSIYGYELLSRGVKKDGIIMPPFEMFSLARESNLSFNLDRQAREVSITNAYKNKIDKKLFTKCHIWP